MRVERWIEYQEESVWCFECDDCFGSAEERGEESVVGCVFVSEGEK